MVTRGQFTARVNGTVSGHHDEWGAFDREEITTLLHAGENVIELDVTAHKGPSGVTSPSAVAASIHVTDGQGREARIVSDGRWEASASADGPWAAAQAIGPLSLAFGIGTNRQAAIPGPSRIVTDASLLRKEFAVGGAVRSARLVITALGAYQAWIDGKPVAPNTLLAPGWTDFHKRVQYQTYDVTPLVRRGGEHDWRRAGGRVV